ncbi:MAG: hypothetical protein IPO61_07465 [Gammaproteobacteria bacterium]|nr:hypothetical protein [Gammaproteobacteria bacterium]
MIIRGGENIYPIEIENELLELDEVKEVAAIGLPHERLGEEVAVVVHLHLNDSLGIEKLLRSARAGWRPTRLLPGVSSFSEEALPWKCHQQGAEGVTEGEKGCRCFEGG